MTAHQEPMRRHLTAHVHYTYIHTHIVCLRLYECMYVCSGSRTPNARVMCAVAQALPTRARLCAHVAPAVGRPRRFRSGRARCPSHVPRDYWSSPSEARHHQPKPWTLNPTRKHVIIASPILETRNPEPYTLSKAVALNHPRHAIITKSSALHTRARAHKHVLSSLTHM